MQTVIRYDIWDNHTKRIVGTAKTRKGANRSVDRRDNEYGAYRYSARPVYEMTVDAFAEMVTS